MNNQDQNKLENSSTKFDNSSVRLSTFNVDLRSKFAKFDSSNQGELSVDDMIHAIVTLQKQSNNYKRLLYIILPLMFIMIACIFGTTILANNLTKELSVNQDGLLVNSKSSSAVYTNQAVEYLSFAEWLQSNDPNDLRSIRALELPNMILPVQTVHVSANQTVIMLEFMFIIIDADIGFIQIEGKKMYENDVYVQNFIDDVKSQLITASKVSMNGASKIDIFSLLSFIFGIQKQSVPPPAASVKPSCSPSGICTAPKPI